MIFNDRVLFLHVPKTAGMSVTRYLLGALPRPTYYSRPPGERDLVVPGVTNIAGPRHETLEEARVAVEAHGFQLSSFQQILATIRNPYDLEVSRYAHLRAGHRRDRGVDQSLALTETFETFARRSGPQGGHRIEEYFTLDGRAPPALQVIRFENLAAELASCLRQAGIADEAQLPRENVSRHDHFASYYTPGAEEAVYDKYRWVFDSGFYERMRLGEPAAVPGP